MRAAMCRGCHRSWPRGRGARSRARRRVDRARERARQSPARVADARASETTGRGVSSGVRGLGSTRQIWPKCMAEGGPGPPRSYLIRTALRWHPDNV